MSGVSITVPLADTTPLPESGAPAAGGMGTATRADHVHARLTSAQPSGTLNSGGEATFMFTRTFPEKPSCVLTYEEAADSQPVILKVKSWLAPNGSAWVSGDYGGCIVKGYRGSVLPAIALNLLGLNIFNAPATGVVVSCVALKAST